MQKIFDVTSYDGYTFQGKLTVPDGTGEISKLVIYVNGSGANTYDMLVCLWLM